MKERVEEIKEERKIAEENEERTFKVITIGSLMDQDLQPFDMFSTDFIKEKFGKIPIAITWDTIIKLSNAAIATGKKVDRDTPYVEALNIFKEVATSGFLVNASTN